MANVKRARVNGTSVSPIPGGEVEVAVMVPHEVFGRAINVPEDALEDLYQALAQALGK